MTDPIARLLGDWSIDLTIYSILLRLSLALIIGALIGCERSSKRHSAGLRTFILITLGTTVASMMDSVINYHADIDIYLISAAAILGASIISIKSLLTSSRGQIKGLTTSAALWASSLIGLIIGIGYYTIGIVSGLFLILALAILPYLEGYLKNRSNHFEVHLELKNAIYLKNFVSTIRLLGLSIDNIELNPAYLNSGLSVYSIAISVNGKEMRKYKTHKEIIEALRSLDYIYHIEEMKS